MKPANWFFGLFSIVAVLLNGCGGNSLLAGGDSWRETVSDGAILDQGQRWNDLGTLQFSDSVPIDQGTLSERRIRDDGREMDADFDGGTISDLGADAWVGRPVLTECDIPVSLTSISPTAGVDELFAKETVQLIEVFVTTEAWDNYCQNGVAMTGLVGDLDFEPLWSVAEVKISGEEIPVPVGIRPWGRSSLRSVFSASDAYRNCLENRFSTKPSLKISFPEYAPGTRFHGLKKVSLAGFQGNETLVSEFVFSALGEASGLPVQSVSHAALCVNNAYWGVYSFQEEYDDRPFVRHHFADPAGTYYKVEAGNRLIYPTDRISRYEEWFRVAVGVDEDLVSLRAFLRFVNFTTTEEFVREAVNWFNVTNWLRTTALELVLHDLDGAYSRGNNFLIYRDSVGIWSIVRKDTDLIVAEDPETWNDEAVGSRLLCYSWGTDNPSNEPDGTAAITPEGYTAWEVRHPIPQARFLYATHRVEYLREVGFMIDLAREMVPDIFNERLETVGPWISADPYFNRGIASWSDRLARKLEEIECQLSNVEEQLVDLERLGEEAICPR